MTTQKTHYRKAFDSPYLSSQDIIEPTVLTISRVELQGDKSKKTKDHFNTAYFVEKEIRQGETLKPMILNATNSRTVKQLTGQHFIDDWKNVKVTIYVEHNIRFGRDSVDGLRISTVPPVLSKPLLEVDSKMWKSAVSAYKRDQNLDAVKERVELTGAQEKAIIEEANFIAENEDVS